MATKLLTQLVLPPCGPLLLVFIGLLLRRRGRRRLGGAGVALGLASLWVLATPVVATGLVTTLESPYPPRPLEAVIPADAIVVLGGGLGPEAPPRIAADLGAASDRVLHAARLYRAGKAPLVVAVGGYSASQGQVPSEGASTRVLLTELGVPADAVLVEESSLDTRGNATATSRLLEQQGLRSVLLVTSSLHMPRALGAFRAAGIDVRPAATDVVVTHAGHRTAADWFPSSAALDLSRRALHEWVGRAYYGLRGWLR